MPSPWEAKGAFHISPKRVVDYRYSKTGVAAKIGQQARDDELRRRSAQPEQPLLSPPLKTRPEPLTKQEVKLSQAVAASEIALKDKRYHQIASLQDANQQGGHFFWSKPHGVTKPPRLYGSPTKARSPETVRSQRQLHGIGKRITSPLSSRSQFSFDQAGTRLHDTRKATWMNEPSVSAAPTLPKVQPPARRAPGPSATPKWSPPVKPVPRPRQALPRVARVPPKPAQHPSFVIGFDDLALRTEKERSSSLENDYGLKSSSPKQQFSPQLAATPELDRRPRPGPAARYDPIESELGRPVDSDRLAADTRFLERELTDPFDADTDALDEILRNFIKGGNV